MSFNKLEWQRKQRSLNGNAWTRRYERTPKGFLMRVYRNMQSRVLGIQKRRAHLYAGLELIPRSDFYSWAFGDEAFTQLFSDWAAAGFPPRRGPSINRIDASRGYTLGNIEWIPFEENCRLGGAR